MRSRSGSSMMTAFSASSLALSVVAAVSHARTAAVWSAVRFAGMAYVVYVEKAREDVLARHGQPIQVADDSPYWGPQKRFFRQLGVAEGFRRRSE